MSIVLDSPIQIPSKVIRVQKIEGVYIDYVRRNVTITIGDYENADDDEPHESMSHGYLLDNIVNPPNLLHFKFVFKRIREFALADKIIGGGTFTEDVTDDDV